MTEIVRRARLFLGSYALMFLLLAIRFDVLWLQITCGAIALIGIVDMARIVFLVSKRTAPEPIKIASVADQGAEISGYLATYLLPFLTVSEPGIKDLIAYLIFFVVLGVVYVRSEMVQINPTLYLFGRRVLRVTTDHGWKGYIVVGSGEVTQGTDLRVATLNADVRIETRR